MTAPKLLVSVRSATEAKLALQGGASIIDIKEPTQGPLGRADALTIAEIAQVVQNATGKQAVARPTTLSVAMGELAELEQLSESQRNNWLPAGDWYVKIGLAGEADSDRWGDRLAAMFQYFSHARPVPVAYWDAQKINAPSPQAVLDWAIKHQSAAWLIDTADKTGQGLFENENDLPALTHLLKQAHGHGLPVALAGRLVGQSFDAAAELAKEPYGPAIIGVRTAACHQQQRDGVICSKAVGELSERLGAVGACALKQAD